MRWVRTVLAALASVLLVALWAGGCAGGDHATRRAAAGPHSALDQTAPAPAAPTAAPHASGPSRASVEPPAAPAAPMTRRVMTSRLALGPVAATEGEDGHGHLVPATQPVALDLHRPEGWPARAEDPVLEVGPLRFTHYSHPAPDVMRFVVADRALLPVGAPVSLVWGDDAASRVVVTPSLTVQP